MSVLIKGMEMPQRCKECDLYIDGACYAKGYRDYRSIMDMSKPADCPLIEVPPHGRLIDADALINELASEHVGGLEAIKTYTGADTWTSGLHTAWRTIDDADTIIEAEE